MRTQTTRATALLLCGLLALLGPWAARPAGAAEDAAADDAAPSLAQARWISAGPVVEGAAGQLVLVEVWATWCGPCHATFPLLTRLQQDYREQLRVVAITDDSPGAVGRAIQADPAAMRFGIAIVDAATVQAFLFGGFGGRGIPSAYLVQHGRVVWGGPPEALEAAITARIGPPSPQR